MSNKSNPKASLSLKPVKPITEHQQKAFEAFNSGNHLFLHGCAGTGKTFISLYLALKEQANYSTQFHKIVILRSVVPARDMGFLPGDEKEKSASFEVPYHEICTDLYDRGDAYEILKSKRQIEFVTTSFLRGMTFSNCILIIDECQNMLEREFDTTLTRVGSDCRVIVAGDYKQSDFWDNGINNQIQDSFRLLKKMPKVTSVEFDIKDIVRSDFAKEWITLKWNEHKAQALPLSSRPK